MDSATLPASRRRALLSGVAARPVRQWLFFFAVPALIAAGACRIAATYRIVSEFADEPAHIACGLEWWEKGVYRLEWQHPPLARLMMAAPLYIKGIRLGKFTDKYSDGNDALTARGQYVANLSLARLGTLPFWILACVLVYAIGKRLYGGAVALLALLLFSTLPPVLGYAGLAYTDMALTTGVLFFAWRWMEFVAGPSLRNSLWLGLGASFALMSKYSAIPYLGAAVALTAIVAPRGRSLPALRTAGRRRAGLLLCAALTTFLLCWACFRFSLEPLAWIPGRHPAVDRRIGRTGALHRVAYWALDTPLPLTQVFWGVAEVYRHAENGHFNYSFGKLRRNGTWYYFPALLALTIPAGLIVLAAFGTLDFKRAARAPAPALHALYAVPAAVLLVNLLSSINIGFRHNLAFYPFVCLAGGVGCAGMWEWRRFRTAGRALAVTLVGQYLISSAMAHPDYAVYFNFLAGSHPEQICAASREGGDVWRLAARLKQLGVTHVCYVNGPGPLPLEQFGLPPYTPLPPNTPCRGWVAVTEVRYHEDLQNSDPSHSGLQWLAPYRPVERVGTSMRLYHIP